MSLEKGVKGNGIRDRRTKKDLPSMEIGKRPEGAVGLRQLSFKTKMGFGDYFNETVQYVIDCKRCDYLRQTYFAFGGITYLPDVLDAIGIPEPYRIKKNRDGSEGRDLEMLDKLDREMKGKLPL